MGKLHVNHQHQLRYSVQQTTFNTSPQHRLPEIRHISRGQSQHQPDFKFGVVAGVGVLTTPTPAFNTELEMTHCLYVWWFDIKLTKQKHDLIYVYYESE